MEGLLAVPPTQLAPSVLPLCVLVFVCVLGWRVWCSLSFFSYVSKLYTMTALSAPSLYARF